MSRLPTKKNHTRNLRNYSGIFNEKLGHRSHILPRTISRFIRTFIRQSADGRNLQHWFGHRDGGHLAGFRCVTITSIPRNIQNIISSQCNYVKRISKALFYNFSLYLSKSIYIPSHIITQ